MNTVNQKIQKAQLKLFRRDVGLQFFGLILSKFEWDVHDITESAIAMVLFDRLDQDKQTADGTIHINSKYVCKDQFTHDNLIVTLMHESLHILNKHGIRREFRDDVLWNFAADHVVDRTITEMTDLPFYIEHNNGNGNIIPELHTEDPNCTVEQAYEWITKQQNKGNSGNGRTSTSSNGGQNGNNTGNGRFKISVHPDGKHATITDTKTGMTFDVNLNQSNVTGNQTTTQSTKYKNSIDDIINQARNISNTLQNQTQKGNISGRLYEYLNEILKVKIPWEHFLEKAIKSHVCLSPHGRAWTRPNKFFRPHGIILPGVSIEESNDGIGYLLIAVDTSGSIGSKILQIFSSIIMESMQYFEKIILYVHDVDVQQYKEFSKDDIRLFYDFIKNEGYKGRGGTSHEPTFNQIENKFWRNHNERENVSMVISLTDGYSDIESIHRKYKWFKEWPTVFIIPGNHQIRIDRAVYDNVQLINIED